MSVLHRSEDDAQLIHDLRRQLDTARASENFLYQELQQLQATRDSVDQKAGRDLQEWQRKHGQVSVELAELQQNFECMKEENSELHRQLEIARAQCSTNTGPANDESRSDDSNERLAELKLETQELLQQVMESDERDVQHMLALAEKDRNIEILTDELACTRENLQCKRLELEEKTQLLESAQEQLTEANAKIAMLTAAPDTAERKGNSLFAEVDDQRQAMKQLLIQQKKSYLQMKKVYNESEQEIRRLKRENNAMQCELKTCTAIFCKADKTYQEKLLHRIKQLNLQNEEQQRQLNWTQERLREMAKTSDLTWVESLLDYCKTNSNDLKVQMHGMRIQVSSLEEQLRNTTQDMARWRFEAIRRRCIVIEREYLLTEHKIAFLPEAEMHLKINKSLLELEKPDLVFNSPTTVPLSKRDQRLPQPVLTCDDIRPALISLQINDDNKENTPKKATQQISTPYVAKGANKKELPTVVSPLRPMSICGLQNEQTLASIGLKDRENKIKPLSRNSAEVVMPGPSILTKKSLFSEATKQVKFSSMADIVHNITPMRAAAPSISKADKAATDAANHKNSNNSGKTQVAVRRYFIGPNNDKLKLLPDDTTNRIDVGSDNKKYLKMLPYYTERFN